MQWVLGVGMLQGCYFVSLFGLFSSRDFVAPPPMQISQKRRQLANTMLKSG